MIYRTLQRTGLLFVTFNNAGGDILKLFFLDEVGQATLPTVLVPITQFPFSEGSVLVQRSDTAQADKADSCIGGRQRGVSKFEDVATRDGELEDRLSIDCLEQATSDVSKDLRHCSRFYPGGIVDSEEAMKDNETWKRVRAIS